MRVLAKGSYDREAIARRHEEARRRRFSNMSFDDVMNANTSANSDGWYPDGNWMNYAYSTFLWDSKSTQARHAAEEGSALIGLTHEELNINNVDGATAVANLESIAVLEEQKELEFLHQHFPNLDLTDITTNPKDFIQAVNLLQPQGLFKKRVDYLMNLEKQKGKYKHKTNSSWRDEMYNFMVNTLQDKLVNKYNETIKVDTMEQLYQNSPEKIDQLLKEVVLDTFYSRYQTLANRDSQIDQDYAQVLLKIIEALETDNVILQKLLQGFGLSLPQLTTRYDNLLKDINKYGAEGFVNSVQKAQIQRTYSHKASFGGTATEAITNISNSIIAQNLKGVQNNEIKVSVQHSGSVGGNIKPDNIMIIEKIYGGVINNFLNWFQEAFDGIENENNPRVKNIRAMREALDKAAGATIVEISDKSYNISGDDFQTNGFKAQGDLSIENLSKVLNELDANPRFLIAIKFLLANSGNNWMNGANYEDIRKQIAVHFAAFLFDDISFNSQNSFKTYHSDAKTIHILNLSGFYIPLSIVLKGIYNSLKSFNPNEVEQWVKVKINVNPVTVEAHTPYKKADWDQTFKTNAKNVSLDLHFMKNFISFMQNVLK